MTFENVVVFQNVEGEKGNFRAVRMSSVRVLVQDPSGLPVEGVLLSLSGKGFRNNSPTDREGAVAYPQLPPGEYFLRMMMKVWV